MLCWQRIIPIMLVIFVVKYLKIYQNKSYLKPTSIYSQSNGIIQQNRRYHRQWIVWSLKCQIFEQCHLVPTTNYLDQVFRHRQTVMMQASPTSLNVAVFVLLSSQLSNWLKEMLRDGCLSMTLSGWVSTSWLAAPPAYGWAFLVGSIEQPTLTVSKLIHFVVIPDYDNIASSSL